MNVKEEIWTRDAYTRTAINLVSAIDDEVREQQNTVFTSRANFDRTLLAERTEFEKRLERRQRRRPRDGVIDLNKSDGLYEEVERQLFIEDEQKTRDEHEAQLAKEHPLAFLDEELEFMLSSYNMLSMLRQKLELLTEVVENSNVVQTKVLESLLNTSILVNDNSNVSSPACKEKLRESLDVEESSKALLCLSKSKKVMSRTKLMKRIEKKNCNVKFFVPQHKNYKLEEPILEKLNESQLDNRVEHKIYNLNACNSANINMAFFDKGHKGSLCNKKCNETNKGYRIPRWAEQITHLKPSLQNYILSLVQHTYYAECDTMKRRYYHFEPKTKDFNEEMGDANSSSCTINLLDQDVGEFSDQSESSLKNSEHKKKGIVISKELEEVKKTNEKIRFISTVYARQEMLCKACMQLNDLMEHTNSELQKCWNCDNTCRTELIDDNNERTKNDEITQKAVFEPLAEARNLSSIDTLNAERPWYLRDNTCAESHKRSQKVNIPNLYIKFTNIKLENEFRAEESNEHHPLKENEKLQRISEELSSELEWYRNQVASYLWPDYLENSIQHTLCAIIDTRVRKWKPIATTNVHSSNNSKVRSRQKPLNITSLPSTAKFG